MPRDLAGAAEAERLRLAAAGGEEVLEEPVDLGEIAGAQAQIEIGLPLTDSDPARQSERRLGKLKLRSLEPNPPVDDGNGGLLPPWAAPNRPGTRDEAGPGSRRRDPPPLACVIPAWPQRRPTVTRAEAERPVPARPMSPKKPARQNTLPLDREKSSLRFSGQNSRCGRSR